MVEIERAASKASSEQSELVNLVYLVYGVVAGSLRSPGHSNFHAQGHFAAVVFKIIVEEHHVTSVLNSTDALPPHAGGFYIGVGLGCFGLPRVLHF